MEVTSDGLNLIKMSEGLCLSSYRCQAGVWTIGYGHTKGVKAGMSISREEAEKYLRDDVRRTATELNNLLRCDRVVVEQNEFDALVSLVYNIGVTNYAGSTLRRKLKAKASNEEVKKAWFMWTKIRQNGKYVTSQGLVNRRNREWELYLGGV